MLLTVFIKDNNELLLRVAFSIHKSMFLGIIQK